MGFFDSFGKIAAGVASSAAESLKNANITKLEENWKGMERISESRLEEVYKDRGINDTTGFLALLKITSKKNYRPEIFDESDSDTAARKGKIIKRMIELSEGKSFDEIRRAIDYFGQN